MKRLFIFILHLTFQTAWPINTVVTKPALVCLVCASNDALVGVSFTAERNRACAPMMVYFTSQTQGITPEHYRWDFGNGVIAHSAEANPHTLYKNAGWYTITLTVFDGRTMHTAVKMLNVNCCC